MNEEGNVLQRIGFEIKAEIQAFKQSLLDKGLAQITDEQMRFYRLLYKDGPKPDQMEGAIQKVRYTIYKNERKAQL